jgi:hypothetical protein
VLLRLDTAEHLLAQAIHERDLADQAREEAAYKQDARFGRRGGGSNGGGTKRDSCHGHGDRWAHHCVDGAAEGQTVRCLAQAWSMGSGDRLSQGSDRD